MRQRLGIASSLLRQPRLLLLDEPTTGLDPAGMRDMRDLVRRLAGEGITILLSSHLLNEVEDLCNRVAIIRKGGIVYEGPLNELLATAATGYRLRATDPERARVVLLSQGGVDGVSLVEGQLRFTADEEAVARAAIALGQARIGITALIFTHIFQNVGMTISILPITGVPLPLISYSGSFALMIMFALGVVNSVWVHRHEVA